MARRRRKKGGIPGLSFSWKRAIGVTSAKRKIARATGIPTTKSGRRNKARRLLTGGGCILPIFLAFGILVVLFGIMSSKGSVSAQNLLSKPNNYESTEKPGSENYQIVYYADDEKINQYVNLFNRCNPDYPITSSDLQKYYHHGREHDDQIRFLRDDFEIIISGGYKTKVYIGYIPLVHHSNDEFRTMFIRFAKPYNPNLDNADLKNYWDQTLTSSTHKAEFDEFEVSINFIRNQVEYLSIEEKF